ncbi:hypothetical protein HDA32_003363 [Spinactinospora alkalitolerans]|uniref:DUF1440 domain-containing protein n=1 Tax=Spinactinospora alkalitolerans TaxID=687207 RepID=A0A852TZP6_9ACTN|nr:hypothetical protein [Spinactinospora alkalitolerans]NYE48243.1 hypothetical protein [Spinactinospora alkalitolerans]
MRLVRSALEGAAAGVLATGAMSAVMLTAQKAGVMGRQPPKLIARRFMPGGGPRRPRPGEDPMTVAAHLGFGAGTGTVFGALSGRRRPLPVFGVGYAMVVWLASYEGWVPALGIQPPIHREAPRRAWVMAMAHVVFGTTLALVLRRMRRNTDGRGDGDGGGPAGGSGDAR